MPAIRGITVAVGDWYARTLAVCLPKNMRHLTECLVITTPRDEAVKAVASKVPGVTIYETEDFFAHGARFNKGLCIERSFDVIGRDGWLLVWDADCLWPDELNLDRLQFGKLHGCTRRILEDPTRYQPSLNWANCAQARDGNSPIGFFQLFHADDPIIRDRRPWYDVSFAHAGGGDAAFLRHWPKHLHVIFGFDVLHLGPRDSHWFGVDPEAKDMMAAFVVRNGWTARNPMVDRSATERVGEIVERVAVPGYAPSTFELPFVRRAQERR